MNKSTKVFLIQFACFAAIFLIARLSIAYFGILYGIWVPIVSGIIAIILSPQFKVFTIDGKEEVFMAWIFSKKGKKITWL